MKCRNCGAELEYATQFCLYCGTKNVDACLVYLNDKFRLFFFRADLNVVESYSFSAHPDSIRNSAELVAERIHWRRIDEVLVSGEDIKAELCAELVKKYALSNLKIVKLEGKLEKLIENVKSCLHIERKLRKIKLKPDEKIGGAHSTIIGGREGRKLLLDVAKCEYVKKIVPGVIEGCGASGGGGVRLKLTRSDEKGNIRAILINGTSVQKVLIVTTACTKDEGEFVRKILLNSLGVIS